MRVCSLDIKFAETVTWGRAGPEKIESFSGAIRLERQGSVKWLAGLDCKHKVLRYLP